MTTGRINQVVMHPEKLFKHWIAVQPKGEPYVFQRYNNAKRTFTEADQYYAIPAEQYFLSPVIRRTGWPNQSMVQRGFPFSEKHPGNFRGICHIELAIKPMEQPQCGTAYNYNTREIVNWLSLQNDDASWPYKQKWLCCFTLAIFKDKCGRKLFSSNKGFFVSHKISRDEKHISTTTSTG